MLPEVESISNDEKNTFYSVYKMGGEDLLEIYNDLIFNNNRYLFSFGYNANVPI